MVRFWAVKHLCIPENLNNVRDVIRGNFFLVVTMGWAQKIKTFTKIVALLLFNLDDANKKIKSPHHLRI